MSGWFVRLCELFVTLVRGCGAWLGGGQGPATERDHVSSFLAFVDDRRVLFSPYFLEYPAHVVDSVRQIEAAARAALAAPALGPAASLRIARVRAACSAFLDRITIGTKAATGAAMAIPGDVLFFGVLALRDSLAPELAALAEDFALDLPRDLALICLPAGRSAPPG